MEKDVKKHYGDLIYKTGDKVGHIYFLREGAIELCYEETKKRDYDSNDENFIIKEFEFKQQRSKKTNFLRSIEPTNIFGVEELLADMPNRTFTARVKSANCFVYLLPKENIFLDLMSKNRTFLTLLQKYSCITNDHLSRNGNIADLEALKKRSYNFCTKDAAQLQQLQSRAKKRMAVGNNLGMLGLDSYDRGLEKFNRELQIEKEASKINQLTVTQADSILKQMNPRTKKKQITHLSLMHMKHFNQNSIIARKLKWNDIRDRNPHYEIPQDFDMSIPLARSQKIAKTMIEAGPGSYPKSGGRRESKDSHKPKIPFLEIEAECGARMTKESLLDFRVNLSRFMTSLAVKKKNFK